MGVPVLPPQDPLTKGKTKVCSFTLPEPLHAELQRQAAIDGYDSVSRYVVQLLTAAIRTREAERARETAKHTSR